MDLPAPLAWLVDEAGASPGPDWFLAELGGRLLADGLPLAGGALTLAVPELGSELLTLCIDARERLADPLLLVGDLVQSRHSVP
jgi:hypothetical protein